MRLRVFGFILLGLSFITLGAYVLSRTKLDLSQVQQDGSSVQVKTSFPNATCQKTLSAKFPFVAFSCDQLEDGQAEELNLVFEPDVRINQVEQTTPEAVSP